MIASAIPVVALVSQIVLVFFFLVFLFRNSWGRGFSNFVGKNALLFGFMAALVAVSLSLFYSEVVGFEPCSLCWWQRVLTYPLLILFAVALKKRDRSVFSYVLPLSVVSAVIALYQSYANLGGASILPCTAVGGACSKVFVLEYGFLTIPLMSLTVALYFILGTLFSRNYEKNNSNT